jgi:hypothetical protein
MFPAVRVHGVLTAAAALPVPTNARLTWAALLGRTDAINRWPRCSISRSDYDPVDWTAT